MHQDLPTPPPKCESFDLDWFTGELKRQYFDSAFSYLLEHVEALSKAYTTDIYEYKSFFGNVIFNITILLENLEYNVKELEDARYSFFKAIEESRSSLEAITHLKHFIKKTNHCIAANHNHPVNPSMKRITEYITENYAQPLTLTNVAKEFHFNPSYLSSFFSSHNHEGFIEYLNKIRIEEAAKLLISGSSAISEIGTMVGYSDHSYFCRVFKKIKGLSPSQYRRKHHKG